MNSKRKKAIQKKLLDWYAVEARDLPWRATQDPYAILVSEIMLQQTRVETVLRYYRLFLARFPTIESLAAATVDEVLKAWEGLGYYRRAHNLHRAARAVVEERGGRVPADVPALRSLPGIGAYSAAAIASIAFGLDEPVLDGNVNRVLARLHRVPGDPAKAGTRRLLRREAERLVSQADASRLNQALMDLGARVCVPRSPRCPACPLVDECDAHHRGEELVYPERGRRRRAPHVDVVAGVVWRGDPSRPGREVLIARRPDDAMLGGLWGFPAGRVGEGESREEALRRVLAADLGIEVNVLGPVGTVEHAYTHFRMTMHAFACRRRSGTPRAIRYTDCAWSVLEGLDRYALSVADRKLAVALKPEALNDSERRRYSLTSPGPLDEDVD